MNKPNVIIFFTDQQRADSTGVHGNPLDLTPNFDRMARKGTFLPESCTCQPVCAPARASVQTGLYPTETGVWRNRTHLSNKSKTMAHHFNNAGYNTAYIGKWHLSGIYGGKENWDQKPVPKDKQGGYQYWLGAELPEFTSDEYHTLLFDKEGNPVRLPGYRSDAYVDAGIKYLTENNSQDKDKPFFLFISIFEPHHQNHRDHFPAPTGYAEKYNGKWTPPDLVGSTEAAAKLGSYWGQIKRVDEGLGRLQDALKSLDLEDNTIILYSSDHGSHFKTRNNEYKRSCHEASVKIPCAITGPGFMNGGERNELFSLVDIAPTLLDAANIPVQIQMQGNSILRDFTVKEQFIQISEDKVSRALRTKRWKYAVTAEGIDGSEVSYSDVYTEEFLYDMEADPYEQQNLINEITLEPVMKYFRSRVTILIKKFEDRDCKIYPGEKQQNGGQRRYIPGDEYH